MRRAIRLLLSTLLSLPAVGSALIIASLPPISRALPGPILGAVREAAGVLFDLVAMLPPDSLAGRLFYASYEPLVPIFGSHALAAHSFILSLPLLALGVLILTRRDPAHPLTLGPVLRRAS